MILSDVQQDFLVRCAKSPAFFIDQLAYIQHPTFGTIRFRLFDYQLRCIKDFLSYRHNIFHKVRQSGISTLCGAFALWRAMFFKGKTILIVSKRDPDAMDFLRKNVKFIYENLPPWIQELWPIEENEHRIVFHTGSRITSLTSSPNTLRSHASSLNIIDEAAFMPKMDEMWSGGWPAIQHGGRTIVISTPNGIGNWYWRTVMDAMSGTNPFNLITVNWWDMKWKLEGKDEASGTKILIAPTSGLVKCVTKEDLSKYGKRKSPWLEEQYRGMASRGEDRLFRQEYLCRFLGTGNTVLSTEQLEAMDITVSDQYKTVGIENYVNPVTGEKATLEFDDKLWIWKLPEKGHLYVIGVDVSSGEAHDYSGVVVWDIIAKEQVAELRIKCRPKTLAMMVDYIGRVYNNAMVVVERNSMGVTVAQELNEDLSYPALYREVKQNRRLRKSMGLIGFNTGQKSKGELNAALINSIGENGYEVRSARLQHEALIYVYKSKYQTGAEDGPGNTDDLVIAAALGLIGVDQAMRMSSTLLTPIHDMAAPNTRDQKQAWDTAHKEMSKKYSEMAGNRLAVPLMITSEQMTKKADAKAELNNFILQLGGSSIEAKRNTIPTISKKKHKL